jgi:predicted nucleic acid-binding protein
VGLVVDASALVYAIRSPSPSATVLRRRLGEAIAHAPHLIDAEVGNVLRRHVLNDEVAPSTAEALLGDAVTLVDVRYETSAALRAAAWALRDNVTFYDALYVVLAQALRLPLLTADAKLARAPQLTCAVELVTAG